MRVGPSRDRAEEIVRTLRLGPIPPEQVDRITLFVRLLGWDRVREAVNYVASRPDRGTIGEPWFYVVGVVNNNSARASYLYTLFHWVELAMRGAADCALADRFGADWHRVLPPVYLDNRHLGTLWRRHEKFEQDRAAKTWTIGEGQPRIRWQRDAATSAYFPAYVSPEDFLIDLDFQALTEVVLHTYDIHDPRVDAILFTPKGERLSYGEARTELRWLREFIRNTIAHNRPPRLDALGGAIFEFDDFLVAAERTERILKALRYNAAPALARHELKRFNVVDAAVQRLAGGTTLQALISQIRPTAR